MLSCPEVAEVPFGQHVFHLREERTQMTFILSLQHSEQRRALKSCSSQVLYVLVSLSFSSVTSKLGLQMTFTIENPFLMRNVLKLQEL